MKLIRMNAMNDTKPATTISASARALRNSTLTFDGSVACLEMNDPASRNAMTQDLKDDLEETSAGRITQGFTPAYSCGLPLFQFVDAQPEVLRIRVQPAGVFQCSPDVIQPGLPAGRERTC